MTTDRTPDATADDGELFYLVTIKLPKNPAHDPRAKVTGSCAANGGGRCTDVTGEHHTMLIRADASETLESVEAYARRVFAHVTRVEETYGYRLLPKEETT